MASRFCTDREKGEHDHQYIAPLVPAGGYASVNRKVFINGKRLGICNVIPETSGYVRGPDLTGVTKVTLHGMPGNPTTDQTGYYYCNLSPGWSGTVTPTLIRYSFDPPSTTFWNLQSSVRTNYTGTLQFIAIYGYVRTENGTPIEGVNNEWISRQPNHGEYGLLPGSSGIRPGGKCSTH